MKHVTLGNLSFQMTMLWILLTPGSFSKLIFNRFLVCFLKCICLYDQTPIKFLQAHAVLMFEHF